MTYNSDKLLFAVDLAGTFVFAVEGATAAIEGELDFFGVMVLSFATASAGGIIRDLLIGAVPPQAIRDWRYAGVAFAAGVFAFFFHHFVRQIPSPVAVGFDAAGLAPFAYRERGKRWPTVSIRLWPF